MVDEEHVHQVWVSDAVDYTTPTLLFTTRDGMGAAG